VLIIEYEVNKVAKRLAQQGINMELDQAAKDFLIERGYNPDYGARPLRRAIGTFIEDPLSELLLSGDGTKGKITVTRKNDAEGKPQDHLYFEMKELAPPPPEEGGKPAVAAQST
jgi:ATP-dependent Clp protease ATP-binding subunit ClpC